MWANINSIMQHPIPIGTQVVAAYDSCQTCGPSHIEKVTTRILEHELTESGSYNYTLLDGRKVSQAEIIEVVL